MLARIWKVLETVTLLAMLPGTAMALEGRVLFPDGRAVADATVSILGQAGSTRTDRQGHFVWRPDPVPPFEVLVVLSDGRYTSPILVEELPAQGLLTVVVRPLASDEVTVTSDVTPHIEAPPAGGMVLMARQQILQQNPARLVDLLEGIPGAEKISEGHAGVPAVRGMARGRTLILIDGARVSTERRAGPSATFLDPFFLEGLEVSRGPGSVAYGSDAFGGIIHALTRRPEAGAPWRFRLAATLAAGETQRAGGWEVSRGVGEGGILAQARWREFEDYRSPSGRVDNSSARSRSFLFRLHQEWGPGQFSLGWQSDLGRDTGRPRSGSGGSRTFQPREDSHRFTLSYQMDPRWGFSLLGAQAFWGSYRLVTDRDNLPRPGRNREVERADVSAQDFSLRLNAVRPVGQGRLEFGLDLNGRFDLEAADELHLFDEQDRLREVLRVLSVEDARRVDSGIYVSGETRLNPFLILSGGARWDRISTRNRGGRMGDRRTLHQTGSGFAALSVTPLQALSLTLQFSRGFRDPSLSDRYFQGLSGRGEVTGNPGLEPETSQQWDLAVRYRLGKWRSALYLYHYRILDLIERFEPQPDQFFFRNRGRARIRGVEWELEGSLGEAWGISLGAHLAEGSDEEEQPLADVPAPRLRLGLRRNLLEKGQLQLIATLLDRDRRPGPTETITPGYARLDLSGAWRLRSNTLLRLTVRNLLDKDYPDGPDARAPQAPGRTGSLQLEVEF